MAFTAIAGSPRAMPGNVELGIADAVDRSVISPQAVSGPPMRGAPWLPRIPVLEAGLLQQPPQPPLRLGAQTYGPDIVGGPPMRGAPWLHLLPQTPPVPPRSPSVGPVNLIANKGFVPRVPDIEGQAGKDRLRRHTEIVQQIFNSLIGTGQLVQTGPASWEIVATGPGAGVISFDGRTGAVVLLSGDVIVALGYIPVPPTRMVNAGPGIAGGGNLATDITIALMPLGSGGTFTNANITVDGYGRVVAASSGSGGGGSVTSSDNSLTVAGGTDVVINTGHTNVWTAAQEFQGNIKADQGGSPGFVIGDLTGDPIGNGSIDIQAFRSASSYAATGVPAVCLGQNCTASANYALAIGSNSAATTTIASGSTSIAIGRGSLASQTAAVAVGSFSFALGVGALGFGNSTNANADAAMALGSGAIANDVGSIAIGSASSAYGTQSIAIGQTASTFSGGYAVAIGSGSSSYGGGVAIGLTAQAQASGATAVGSSSIAGGSASFAMGTGAAAYGANSVAVGNSAAAHSDGTIAIGASTDVAGVSAMALGNGASASAKYASAIGPNVTNSVYGTTKSGFYNPNTASGYYWQIGPAGVRPLNIGYLSRDGSAGLTQVVALAKLTTLGSNGSATFKDGILTAYSAPT